MKVTMCPLPQETLERIYRAYRTCYSAAPPMNINIPTLSDGSTDRAMICKFILDHIKHESPLEHISVTFMVSEVSRSLTHQLVRHRLASYSQQSQRYVKLEQFGYVIPPAIEKNMYAKTIFLETMKRDQEAYDMIVEELLKGEICEYWDCEGVPMEVLQDMMNKPEFITGFREGHKGTFSKMEKQACEDARYVFPNACYTNIIFSMNLRELRHFFDERQCKYAQWEIRNLANECRSLIEPVLPFIGYNARKCGRTCFECHPQKEVLR